MFQYTIAANTTFSLDAQCSVLKYPIRNAAPPVRKDCLSEGTPRLSKRAYENANLFQRWARESCKQSTYSRNSLMNVTASAEVGC